MIIENFPEWAISAVVNNDFADLTRPEIDAVRTWKNTLSKDSVIIGPTGEPYFSWSPEFGLPSQCVDLQVTEGVPNNVTF